MCSANVEPDVTHKDARSCLKSGLKCTEVCSWSECQNNPHVIDGEDESDSSDNDDEDDYDLGDDDNMFDDLSE